MVGTRHAVSDNKNRNGPGMPSPYNRNRYKNSTLIAQRLTPNIELWKI